MNQRGSTTIAMVILAPLFATLLGCLAAAYLVFKGDAEIRQTCRVELLRAQDQVSQKLRELMALNPQAAALRARLQIAEAQAAAIPPPANAPILAMITEIKLEQMALAVRQKTLIASAKLLSRASPLSVSMKVGRAIAGLRYDAPTADRRSFQTGSFDVIASPHTSLTPSYEPSPRFTAKQTMSVRWVLAVAGLLPNWSRELARATGLELRGHCSATIEKGGQGWLARLTVDRS